MCFCVLCLLRAGVSESHRTGDGTPQFQGRHDRTLPHDARNLSLWVSGDGSRGLFLTIPLLDIAKKYLPSVRTWCQKLTRRSSYLELLAQSRRHALQASIKNSPFKSTLSKHDRLKVFELPYVVSDPTIGADHLRSLQSSQC